VAAFADVLARVVREFRPNVVLTYGGDPASRTVVPIATGAGAGAVFWVQNFAYRSTEAFRGCAAVVVPSTCARDYYRATLGVDPIVLPVVVDPARVVAPDPDPRFLTFVNPDPAKGVFLFARLADVLGRVRPDVPLLVVEGRGRADWLGRCGVDLTGVRSVHRMANTPDPRTFYRISRVVVVPSVWRETFGRVAVEALLNGIPVVASDRGALPDTVGPGGLCLPVPAWMTPDSRTPPSAAEVRPWVEAVLRLWDAADGALQARATAASARWQPEAVLPAWESFLLGHKSLR
jgi:glycosyltransferase involved in cell wall biosynthesis